MLQTSSNQRNSHRLTRTPVTNVVNPSPKTAIISEKALRLTTFVTTDQKCAQKTPRIDDVCNNMHQSTPKNSTRETPVTPTGSRGTGPRCRRAVAGPGQTTSQRTEQHQRPGTTGVEGRRIRRDRCDTHGRRQGLAATPAGGGGAWPGFEATRKATHQRPGLTGVEGAGGTGGPGCDTRGPRRGLAGLRSNAPSNTSATTPHRCGGRRRVRRARAGFEARRRTK